CRSRDTRTLELSTLLADFPAARNGRLGSNSAVCFCSGGWPLSALSGSLRGIRLLPVLPEAVEGPPPAPCQWLWRRLKWGGFQTVALPGDQLPSPSGRRSNWDERRLSCCSARR